MALLTTLSAFAPREVRLVRRSTLGQDFRRLWGAYAVSAAGSAVGMGALPLIALLVLDSSAFQVSVLAALSAVASALIALPLGVRIEHQYKRPVMITADLARCLLLASIPVAVAFDMLTFTQLCVVGVLQTAASVAFDAASGAHLKALVLPEHRLRANSLFETSNWISVSAGPLGRAVTPCPQEGALRLRELVYGPACGWREVL